tara:strand:+ start:390 stop:1043 length:654 start_codon:yes stop_codon:yes gene_type:complete
MIVQTTIFEKKSMTQSKIDALKLIISDEFNVDVNKNSRLREVVEGRKAFAYILRKYNVSTTFIGNQIDKDHSTILHYVRNLEHELAYDSIFSEKLRRSEMRFEKIMKKTEPIESQTDEMERDSMLKLYAFADENEGLKQTIKRLKKKVKSLDAKVLSLEGEVTIAKREEERLSPIYEMLKERVKVGKEDRVYNSIRRLLNNDGLKRFIVGTDTFKAW